MITNQEMKDLRERNEERLKQVKEKLGSKWLLHPENKIRKQEKNK